MSRKLEALIFFEFWPWPMINLSFEASVSFLRINPHNY